MSNNLTTGQAITLLRKQAGFKTQEALAEKMYGYNRGKIASYEADLANPPLDFIRLFVRLVGCSYQEVIEGYILPKGGDGAGSTVLNYIRGLGIDSATKATLEAQVQLLLNELASERHKRETLNKLLLQKVEDLLKSL